MSSLHEFPPFALKLYTIGDVKVGNQTFADYFNRERSALAYCGSPFPSPFPTEES